MGPDENNHQSLSAYMKQQKHLRTKEKMRNVRIWKKHAMEYREQTGGLVDDPAKEREEKPDSNKSIDTKEQQRLQQIENDYTEQEKILKLVSREYRNKNVKNSDSQPDVNSN
jgi:hypothetical protein